MPVRIINSMSTNIHAYITGLDASNRNVFVSKDAFWSLPNTNSSSPEPIHEDQCVHSVPAHRNFTIVVPGCLSAARIWISEDAGLNFGVVRNSDGKSSLVEPSLSTDAQASYTFMELTHSPSQTVVNPTYVDMTSRIPMSFEIRDSKGGPPRFVGGLKTVALDKICAALRIQETVDGQPWSKLCVKSENDTWLRVLSPRSYISLRASNAFEGYFQQDVEAVWKRFSAPGSLQITDRGEKLNCTVNADTEQLVCSPNAGAFPRPSSQDIFLCDGGTFVNRGTDSAKRVISTLAAAFNRGTLLSTEGNQQPTPSKCYYPTNSTVALNWYSKLVHQWQQGGEGYAFPYDDVAISTSQDSSGLISVQSPAMLKIWLGHLDGQSVESTD